MLQASLPRLSAIASLCTTRHGEWSTSGSLREDEPSAAAVSGICDGVDAPENWDGSSGNEVGSIDGHGLAAVAWVGGTVDRP
jgi:hypothetical protein